MLVTGHLHCSQENETPEKVYNMLLKEGFKDMPNGYYPVYDRKKERLQVLRLTCDITGAEEEYMYRVAPLPKLDLGNNFRPEFISTLLGNI